MWVKKPTAENQNPQLTSNYPNIMCVNHTISLQNIEFVYLQIKEKNKNEKSKYTYKAHPFNYIPIIFNIYNRLYTNNY